MSCEDCLFTYVLNLKCSVIKSNSLCAQFYDGCLEKIDFSVNILMFYSVQKFKFF